MTNERIELHASTRNVVGKKVKQLRAQGMLPVVVYGNDREAAPLQVRFKDFKRVFAVASTSSIVTLMVDGKEEPVLIHELDRDPVTDVVRHADLYKINLTEKIETEVPLTFSGVAAAVKELEGVLVKNFDEITVECLPTEIPKEIVVDISVLATFDDAIHVSDLVIPEGVTVLKEMKEVVAVVTPPRSEEELDALSAEIVEDVESVEGVKKEEPKEDAEGEEGGEEKAVDEKKPEEKE
jgi:large subunit ribosomal protein L25